MGAMKGLGAALPYAGAAAGGLATGMQNKRQLEQGERMLLLQETENEMKKRGLQIDEEQHSAQFGPTSATTGAGLGQAVGAPAEWGAALTGQPFNQAHAQANLFLRDSNNDEKNDIARIKAGGSSGDDVTDSLKLTKEIRYQRGQVISAHGQTIPRDLLNAMVREDPKIDQIMMKYAAVLEPSILQAVSEVAVLIAMRAKRYGHLGYGNEPSLTPSAGQPQPVGPPGMPKAPGAPVKSAPAKAAEVWEYDATGKRIK